MRFVPLCLGAALITGIGADNIPQIPIQDSKSTYRPFSHSFDNHVDKVLKELYTPGMAIAVVRGNETWTKGYGLADIEADEPVTPYTLFHGASTTKVHTASLVALLVQDNDTYADISFDTMLHHVTPEFQLMDMYETVQVTFADALSHRTGMPRHDISWLASDGSIEDQVHSLRYLPRTAPFRTKYQYCNLMYTAVAHAIQSITKAPIGELYSSWLWKPLNLTTTFSSIKDAQQCQDDISDCRISKHYLWSRSKGQYIERDPSALPAANGATGWITNMVDQAKWIRALMQAGGPVSPEGHAAIRTPHSIPTELKDVQKGPEWYGMGLRGSLDHGHVVLNHGGAIGSYYTNSLFIPELNWGIVVMQNAPTCAMSVVSRRLIDDLLHIHPSERKDGIKECLAQFEKDKQKIEAQPHELYPLVSSPPKLPTLQVTQYAGTYTHPAFDRIKLVPGVPADGVFKGRRDPNRGSMLTLHANLPLLDAVLVFYHVSGENWLVATYEHENMDDDVPTVFTKARSLIGADGSVEAFEAILETSVKGDAAWTKFVKKN